MNPKGFLVFLKLVQEHLDTTAWPLAFKHTPEVIAKNYYQHTLCRVASQEDKSLLELQDEIAPFTTPQNLQLFQCDNRLWAFILVNAFQNTHLCPTLTKPSGNLSEKLKKIMPKITQKISKTSKTGNAFLPGLVNHKKYYNQTINIFKEYLEDLASSNKHESIQAFHSLFYYLRHLCLEQDGNMNQESLKTISMHFSAAMVAAFQINIYKDQQMHLAQLYQFTAAINYCLLTSDLFEAPYCQPTPINELSRTLEQLDLSHILATNPNLITGFKFNPMIPVDDSIIENEEERHDEERNQKRKII